MTVKELKEYLNRINEDKEILLTHQYGESPEDCVTLQIKKILDDDYDMAYIELKEY